MVEAQIYKAKYSVFSIKVDDGDDVRLYLLIPNLVTITTEIFLHGNQYKNNFYLSHLESYHEEIIIYSVF